MVEYRFKRSSSFADCAASTSKMFDTYQVGLDVAASRLQYRRLWQKNSFVGSVWSTVQTIVTYSKLAL
jgi:hypothetical protein